MLLSRNSGHKDTAFLLIDKHFVSFLRIPFWIAEQNREQGACSHCKRIIEIADDTDGGDAGKSRCNQHLRSVWNNTLYQACLLYTSTIFKFVFYQFLFTVR